MLDGHPDSPANPGGIEKDFLTAFEEYSDALFRHCLLRVRDRELLKGSRWIIYVPFCIALQTTLSSIILVESAHPVST
jgi:hypothetical protein